MVNKLFLDSAFIRISDIYDNYAKKYSDYYISFEQFYMALYQKKINLYIHTYNIGIKADIAIFPVEIGSINRDSELYFDRYKDWVKDNQDRINSINNILANKVNHCGLRGGVFFKLSPHDYMNAKLGYSIPIDFLPIDLYSIHGELIFSFDEVFSVCEQHFQDEGMPDINVAPTEFIAIMDRLKTIPELIKDNGTGLTIININNNVFLKNDDAIAILNNFFDSSVDTHPEQIESKKKPIGVSKEKIEAKRYARNIADYLWRKDIENKIKIKEMAINVYAELHQTEYKDQLPDKPESLKEWIKDIAPNYAKESGRPKVEGG